MSARRRLPLVGLVLACMATGLLAVGCGSSDSSTSSTPTKTATVPGGTLGAVPAGAGKPFHAMHYHFNGYQGKDGNGSPFQCGLSESSDANGGCYFQQEHTDGRGDPFNATASFQWKDAGGICKAAGGNATPAGGPWQHQVRLYSGPTASPTSELCGWIDKGWVKMAVTGGSVHGKAVVPTHDPTRSLESQGGPLYVFMSHRSHPRGYILGLRGQLQY